MFKIIDYEFVEPKKIRVRDVNQMTERMRSKGIEMSYRDAIKYKDDESHLNLVIDIDGKLYAYDAKKEALQMLGKNKLTEDVVKDFIKEIEDGYITIKEGKDGKLKFNWSMFENLFQQEKPHTKRRPLR